MCALRLRWLAAFFIISSHSVFGTAIFPPKSILPYISVLFSVFSEFVENAGVNVFLTAGLATHRDGLMTSSSCTSYVRDILRKFCRKNFIILEFKSYDAQIDLKNVSRDKFHKKESVEGIEPWTYLDGLLIDVQSFFIDDDLSV